MTIRYQDFCIPLVCYIIAFIFFSIKTTEDSRMRIFQSTDTFLSVDFARSNLAWSASIIYYLLKSSCKCKINIIHNLHSKPLFAKQSNTDRTLISFFFVPFSRFFCLIFTFSCSGAFTEELKGLVNRHSDKLLVGCSVPLPFLLFALNFVLDFLIWFFQYFQQMDTVTSTNKGYQAEITVITYSRNRKEIDDRSKFRILLVSFLFPSICVGDCIWSRLKHNDRV